MSDKQLPDGIEWPRYDDGGPLGIGDCFLTPILHAKAQVKSIAFKGMCATIETDRGAHCKFGVGCRVMRPPVLDKDGQEIKVKQLKPEWLTHERPDSWERLEEDARKGYIDYWSCQVFDCCDCPAKVDGKTPRQRYGVGSCTRAKALDILARAEKLAGVRGDE